MNKFIHSMQTQTQRFPVELSFVKSESKQTEDHKNMNYSSNTQALEAYLNTLGIPTSERSKLSLQVEARLQSQGIADSNQVPLTRLIQEAHRVINMEKGYLDAVMDTQDWIRASTEWRLQYWLMNCAAEPQQVPEHENVVHDFETLLIAPPVRRVSMPVASLKSNQWENIVQFLVDKLALVGASTAQTFRRLLANTLNG